MIRPPIIGTFHGRPRLARTCAGRRIIDAASPESGGHLAECPIVTGQMVSAGASPPSGAGAGVIDQLPLGS